MADTTLIEVTTESLALLYPNGNETAPARRHEVFSQLERFFNKAACGLVSPGTKVSLQQNTGESAASASATITCATVLAGDGVLINGVLFVGTSNATVASGAAVCEFTRAASNTTTATNLAAAINACTDKRISGVVTAASALGVVTVTSVDQSDTANAPVITPIGQVARANVAYSSSSGAQTVSINGVSISLGTGASDAANAAACASNINSSVNALVLGYVAAVQGGSGSNTSCYIYSLIPGVGGNVITLAVTGTGATASAARLGSGASGIGAAGVLASGTVTISGGSGSETATINGVGISVTWATSDAATASALAAAIQNSTNALIAGVVTATVASNVVTITAAQGGATGNAITLAGSGTGVSASGARLTGGAAPLTLAVGSAGTLEPGQNLIGSKLTGGIGGEQGQQTYTF